MSLISTAKYFIRWAFYILIAYSLLEFVIINQLDRKILQFCVRYFFLCFTGATLLFATYAHSAKTESLKTSRSIGGLVLHFFCSILVIVIYRIMFFDIPEVEMGIAAATYILSLIGLVLLIFVRK